MSDRLQQSEHYKQLQTLNPELEHCVQQRTQELAKVRSQGAMKIPFLHSRFPIPHPLLHI
ncbi:GAF domain-containing protein [Nostoc sp. DSM 114160]|jgi:C4-dicarboxylate-specific signal transduction histidine kinase